MQKQLEICSVDVALQKMRMDVSVTISMTSGKRDLIIASERFVCKENTLGALLQAVVYATLGAVIDVLKLNRSPPSIRLIEVQLCAMTGEHWISVVLEVEESAPKIRFGTVHKKFTDNLLSDIATAAASATLMAIEKDLSSYLNAPFGVLDLGKKQRFRRWWKKMTETE